MVNGDGVSDRAKYASRGIVHASLWSAPIRKSVERDLLFARDTSYAGWVEVDDVQLSVGHLMQWWAGIAVATIVAVALAPSVPGDESTPARHIPPTTSNRIKVRHPTRASTPMDGVTERAMQRALAVLDKPEPLRVDGDGAFEQPIVGESYYLDMFGEIVRRRITSIEFTRPLLLAQLHGAGLARLGITASATAGADYAHARQLALDLWSHPSPLDGVLYRARHDDEHVSVALFHTAESGLRVGSPRPLTDDRGWLAGLAVRYGFDFMP